MAFASSPSSSLAFSFNSFTSDSNAFISASISLASDFPPGLFLFFCSLTMSTTLEFCFSPMLGSSPEISPLFLDSVLVIFDVVFLLLLFISGSGEESSPSLLFLLFLCFLVDFATLGLLPSLCSNLVLINLRPFLSSSDLSSLLGNLSSSSSHSLFQSSVFLMLLTLTCMFLRLC